MSVQLSWKTLAKLFPIPLAVVFLSTTSCTSRSSSIEIHKESTNVIFLTVCTLRADHLGAAGYPIEVSPTIDSLARNGLFFDHVLTGAPWTRASIASMITGIYPRSLGIEDRVSLENDRVLHGSFETLAELFHSAGYATIGITANPNTNRIFNFQQGYDFYQDTKTLWRDGYDEDKVSGEEVFDILLEQLRGPFHGRKFFAHLVIVDVHLPYLMETAVEKTGGFEPGGKTSRYDQQIRYVDTIVGELMGDLDDLGLQNTLLVLTSDHGEGFREGRRSDYRHGKQLYNSTIWTPLLLHHPALRSSARKNSEMIESVDILPTLLDILGIGWDDSMVQGRSLKESVLGNSPPVNREFGIVETAMMGVNKSAIIHDGWKLIVNYGTRNMNDRESRELYRFVEDPLEQSNRAEDESEVADHLFRRLKGWQDSCDARLSLLPEDAAVSDEERRALEALGYLRD